MPPRPYAVSLSTALLVIGVNLIWAVTNVLGKVGLSYFFPPVLFAGSRFLVAGLIFGAVVRLQGEPFPREGRTLGRLVTLGLIHTSIFYGCFYLGLQHITAGKSSVILSSQPFWVFLAAPYLLGEQRFTPPKIAGIAAGVAGVAVIFYPDVVSFRVDDLVGSALVLVSAWAWAAGTIYLKRAVPAGPLTVVNAVQMFVGAVPLVVLGLALEGTRRVVITPASAAVFVFVSVIGACVPYFLWFRALRENPSGILSSFNLLQVVFVVTIGAIALHEPVTAALVAGTALVCAGIYVVNRF